MNLKSQTRNTRIYGIIWPILTKALETSVDDAILGYQ